MDGGRHQSAIGRARDLRPPWFVRSGFGGAPVAAIEMAAAEYLKEN